MSDENFNRFLRYPEAAALLGISTATLRKYVLIKQVPYHKPFGTGRHHPTLFDPNDLIALVRASRVEPVSA